MNYMILIFIATMAYLCSVYVVDLFQGQNPNITKREMDFHYGGDPGVVCRPPANFFGPRRRKPTNSELGLHKNSLGNRLEMPCNEMVARVTEGQFIVIFL